MVTSAMSVSYTHLVFNAEEGNWQFASAGIVAPNTCTYIRVVLPMNRQMNFADFTGIYLYPETLGTVSYTHLDVYKRQSISSCLKDHSSVVFRYNSEYYSLRKKNLLSRPVYILVRCV